jgi:hypothetical protein
LAAESELTPAFEAVLRSSFRRGMELTDEAVRAAMTALDEVAQAYPDAERPGIRTPVWQLWVQRTQEYFAFTTEEATFEACDDEDLIDKPRPDFASLTNSRLIVSQFHSTLPPSAFAEYVDPERWPKCSPFWKSMVEVPPNNRKTLANGYDCRFLETVSILGRNLTVPLDVAYRTSATRCWVRFNIDRVSYSTAVPVDVDTGTVSAARAPGETTTLVQATKYVNWGQPGTPDYSSLSCDFGWCELMIEMAYRCTGGPPALAAATEETGGATPSVEDAAKAFAEGVTSECRDSVGQYEGPLEKLIGRFTGPSWDARWINDLLDMGKVTVDRYGRIASTVRRFADDLKNAESTDGGNG